ncbi:serine hydrolase [Aeromicrobium sp.]|uniref:serine hydrolase n=1 Tax=Aeromicrobium sp. TaxID=1871063 RepID=UPI002FC7C1D5
MVKSWMFWVVGLVMSSAVASSAISADAQSSRTAALSPSTSTASATTSTSNSSAPDLSGLAEISTDADFAVEVLNLDTGETASYGGGSFDTASIVKVDILAALLFQAQHEGRGLTASEQSQAAAMIERSDNTAATTLFNAVGGKSGLEEFNDMIGLEDTVVGSNGNWGLTQTTSADQIRLLKVVFGSDSVLTSESQAYMKSLMSNVIDSQDFGVSAADDDGDAALKVGYLQRSATGLWDVTSIGEIEAGGETFLVAVLSEDNSSYEAGVALVDEVAQAAVSSVVE